MAAELKLTVAVVLAPAASAPPPDAVSQAVVLMSDQFSERVAGVGQLEISRAWTERTANGSAGSKAGRRGDGQRLLRLQGELQALHDVRVPVCQLHGRGISPDREAVGGGGQTDRDTVRRAGRQRAAGRGRIEPSGSIDERPGEVPRRSSVRK